MSENTSRVIENMGLLDLTSMKSPDELNNISRITNVGAIIVPESLMAKLLSILQENIGATVPVPDGKDIKVNSFIGSIKMSGEGLAAPKGEGDQVLVVVGSLIVTTPVEKIGYSQASIIGTVLVPRGSEAAMTSSTIKIVGSVSFYPLGANIRMFNSEDRLSAAFFDLLKEPIYMVVNGHVVIEPDVTVELLQSKVTEIIVNGMLEGSKAVLPVLQVLTTEKNGMIQVADEGKGAGKDEAE